MSTQQVTFTSEELTSLSDILRRVSVGEVRDLGYFTGHPTGKGLATALAKIDVAQLASYDGTPDEPQYVLDRMDLESLIQAQVEGDLGRALKGESVTVTYVVAPGGFSQARRPGDMPKSGLVTTFWVS